MLRRTGRSMSGRSANGAKRLATYWNDINNMEDENQNVMPVLDYPSFPLSSYMCLKILSCNAHLACPFSEAYIDMVPMQNDREDVYFFPLQTLTPKAHSFLSLETNSFTGIRIADPENATGEQKAAFHCLQNFLHSE